MKVIIEFIQLATLFNVSAIFIDNMIGFLSLTKTGNAAVSESCELNKSFVYNVKNKEPSMDHCGILQVK